MRPLRRHQTGPHRPHRRPVRRVPALAGPVARVPRVEPLIGRELAGEIQTSRFHLRRGELPPPSEILQKRSKLGMKLGELWDHMLDRDAFLSGLWAKRWKAVLGLPRYILPRDESPRAKEIADFCRLALSEVPNLHTNLVHQMRAMTHGWSAEEILWQRRTEGDLAGKWGLDLIDRPMWRFLYDQDRRLHVRRPDGQHVLAPPGKFLVMRTGSKDNPWGGLGLLHSIYWYWFSGEHGWKYFAVLIEKWAQPTAVGKYNRSINERTNNESVAQLFQALHQIQTEYSIVIPDDLVLETLEAKRNGGEVSYEKFIKLANLAKALLFLGEADTSGFEQGQGSFARRKVSNTVRLETLRIDAHEFDAHLTDNLLRLLVEVNFGIGAPVPYWYTEVDDAEELSMRQERADAMLDRGFPLPLEDYYRLNKQRMPRVGESIVRTTTGRTIEVVDPPEGFELGDSVHGDQVDAEFQADDGQVIPFTAGSRAALRRYRTGDIHQFELLAA